LLDGVAIVVEGGRRVRVALVIGVVDAVLSVGAGHAVFAATALLDAAVVPAHLAFVALVIIDAPPFAFAARWLTSGRYDQVAGADSATFFLARTLSDAICFVGGVAAVVDSVAYGERIYAISVSAIKIRCTAGRVTILFVGAVAAVPITIAA